MFEIGQLTRLPLGYVGENGTRTISIDMKAWLDEYPGALIMIQVIRPIDHYKYPAAYTKTDGVIHWTVDGSEVMYAGKGLAQIALYNPDTKQEYKSRVVGTVVAESIDGFNDIMLEETDPASKWVNRVLEAAESAEASKNDAANSKEEAEAAIAIVAMQKNEALIAIQNEGAAQVVAVNDAGTQQAQFVEAKGEEVLGKIPEDYTELSNSVATLTEEIGDVAARTDLFVDYVASKNLFNKNKIVEGYLYNNGVIAEDTSYVTTDYLIPVQSGKYLVCSYTQEADGIVYTKGMEMLIGYDKDKNLIPDAYYMDDYSVIIPDGWAYAKICLYAEHINTTMLFQSDSEDYSVPYEPYFDPYYARKDIHNKVEYVTRIQKEVVSTSIELVESGRNAALYGVLPSNDGSTNYKNLQSLLNSGGRIVVDVVGTYEIDGQLEIGSDTELIFGKQVYMKKVNSVGGFLINKGAFAKEYDSNIRIDGLNLICNGSEGDGGDSIYGLNGQISFYYVKNLVFENCTVDDIVHSTYYFHCCCWENVLVQNCWIAGDKDGLHFDKGRHLTIRNCKFATGDDPIALNAYDYPDCTPEYGWIEDVLVENCVDVNDGRGDGRFSLMLGGAWLSWKSGNKYRTGDVAVSNGKVYAFIGDYQETLFESTVAPDHESGEREYSDGCRWRYKQNEVLYSVGVKNITFRNIMLGRNRASGFKMSYEDDIYCRAYYPGAIAENYENITFDGISVDRNFKVITMFDIKAPVNIVRCINGDLQCQQMVIFSNPEGFSDNENNRDTALTFSNNYITKRPDQDECYFMFGCQGKRVTINAYGNIKKDNFEMLKTGSHTEIIKANDLTN